MEQGWRKGHAALWCVGASQCRGIGAAPPMASGRLTRWGVAAMEGFGKAAMGAKNMCSFLESSIHPFFPLVPAPKPSTLY